MLSQSGRSAAAWLRQRLRNGGRRRHVFAKEEIEGANVEGESKERRKTEGEEKERSQLVIAGLRLTLSFYKEL